MKPSESFMTARSALVGLLTALALAGCATAADPARALHVAQAPCLPPGIPADVFLWPVVDSGTLGRLPLEEGGTVPMVYLLYQRGEHSVVVGWVGGRILLVDPEPESSRAPWFNGALINATRQIRTAPAETCQWRRGRDSRI